MFSTKLKAYFAQKKVQYYTVDDIDNLANKIQQKNITHVIYDNRKSCGQNLWNTSYIEDKLEENLRFNLVYPILAANICQTMIMHFTHIGEGCIFKDANSMEPDLKVSNHSLVNIYNEKLTNELFENTLYLRIRYPVSGDFKPNCHLMKLLSYKNTLDTDNSITVVEDIMPIFIELLNKKKTGCLNMFGNNGVNSVDVLLKLKEKFDSMVNFSVITKEHHNRIVGERSNGVFQNNDLQKFCFANKIELPNTNESINNTIEKMALECTELKKCLCCGELNITLLDMGYQPLANDFHGASEVNSVYPLRLKYCQHCFHCQ